jgi:hypothetical protein
LINTLLQFNLHGAGVVDGWAVYTSTADASASPAPLVK